MKKVITILAVLAMVISAVFAADANTVKVKVDIEKIIPAFALYYDAGESAGNNRYQKGNDISVVDPSGDLADASKGITASFAVKQEGSMKQGGTAPTDVKAFSRWGSTGESGSTVTLTVTCGKFIYQGLDGNTPSTKTAEMTADPTIEAKDNGAAPASGALTYEAVTSSGNTVTFKPVYHGKKVADQILGTFTAKWAGNADLPFGTYKADISLTYTGI